MNERGHAVNAILLGVGIGVALEPSMTLSTVQSVITVGVPVVLGALFPDVDTHFGIHRKTLHNLPVLAVVAAYPVFFDNLQWVWLGVLTHYVLDVLGTTRGIALFYPLWDEEFNLPLGVPVDSKYANAMMLAVTAFELSVAALLVFVVPATAYESVLRALGAG